MLVQIILAKSLAVLDAKLNVVAFWSVRLCVLGIENTDLRTAGRKVQIVDSPCPENGRVKRGRE